MEAAKDIQYVLCLNNDGYPVSLEVGKIYEVLPEGRPERGLIRVIDESGEDYLYSAKRFAPVEQPQAVPSTDTDSMLIGRPLSRSSLNLQETTLDARRSIEELVGVL